MTEKQDFLEKLKAALIERDISEVDIEPYIERFDRFYDRMVNDPENNDLDLMTNIDTIANNIAEQVSERYDDINRLAERTLTVDRVVDDKSPAVSEMPSDGSAESEQTTNDSSDTEPEVSDEPTAEMPIPMSADNAVVRDIAVSNDEKLPDEPRNRLPEYVDEEPSPNSTIFWVLFAVSLPITIPLLLAVIALFIIVWGGLCALIVASIGALILAAAGGTALSLVGIIYGITKLFSEMPIGLYEIGLGVLVGGCVMFAGILLYNFAVRLLPLLIKLVGRLFKYLYKQFWVLFAFLRKECAKL
ncbi:MAG: hypothetical protein HFE63_00070 [Clostridiales bacterium]|nr:hypothetical protein [Clostridiales bacterium]